MLHAFRVHVQLVGVAILHEYLNVLNVPCAFLSTRRSRPVLKQLFLFALGS